MKLYKSNGIICFMARDFVSLKDGCAYDIKKLIISGNDIRIYVPRTAFRECLKANTKYRVKITAIE